MSPSLLAVSAASAVDANIIFYLSFIDFLDYPSAGLRQESRSWEAAPAPHMELSRSQSRRVTNMSRDTVSGYLI